MEIDSYMDLDDSVVNVLMDRASPTQDYDMNLYLAAAEDSSLLDVKMESEDFSSWPAPPKPEVETQLADQWSSWCAPTSSETHDGMSEDMDAPSPPPMPITSAPRLSQHQNPKPTRSGRLAAARAASHFRPESMEPKPVVSFGERHMSPPRTRESNLRQFALQPDDPVPESLSDLTDNQLAMIDFKILMQLMDKAGLTSQQVSEVKSRRRRLKNRLSARVCSNKKREKCSELEDTNRGLLSSIRHLSFENQKLKEDLLKLQDTNETLTKASFDSARETAALRAQVNHLSTILAQAGLLDNGADQDDDAAFAA